ncbi:hypothetical protein DFH09DRAFT_1285611 [Mycena vulgaris]|nr:hypothetical protein DFH09DRAFT_1285611 [Mycena vulgaris]
MLSQCCPNAVHCCIHRPLAPHKSHPTSPRPTRRTMRFVFPSRAKLKPSSLSASAKPSSSPSVKAASSSSAKPSSRPGSALSDVLWTSVLALKESADAFPPLKSAVAGVVAVCEIAERAKHSKADARDIALRTKEILDVVADAVPDGSAIPPPMLRSIERFTVLLDDVRCRMDEITLTGRVSRLVHLNRNERTLQGVKAQLDDAYRDFVTASTLRLEVHQARLAVRQEEMHGKVVESSDASRLELERALFYSRLSVFLAGP